MSAFTQRYFVTSTLMVPFGKLLDYGSCQNFKTNYGHKLYVEALPLLRKIDSLRSVDLTLGQDKRLNIAGFGVFTTYFLAKLVAENFFWILM